MDIREPVVEIVGVVKAVQWVELREGDVAAQMPEVRDAPDPTAKSGKDEVQAVGLAVPGESGEIWRRHLSVFPCCPARGRLAWDMVPGDGRHKREG